MSKTKQHKKLLKNIIIISVLVVLAAAAGVGVRWWQIDQMAKEASKPTAIEQKIFDSQNKVAGGDYESAHKDLDDSLKNNYLSTDEKYSIIAQQGTTYENEKNYPMSIEKYKAAEGIKPTQDVAESIARVSEASGDKETAITYYKTATSRIDPNSPIADADRSRYGDLIRILGGQP